jgi:hypothetical protein
MHVTFFILFFAAALFVSRASAASPALVEWERGFGLRIPGEPAADMFFWIYEWNMFEAMQAGQHTHGTYQLPRRLNADATEAVIDAPALRLVMRTVPDGAALELRVTNTTGATWPAIAGIIPCWNPGMVAGTNPSMPASLNRNFADPWRLKSFFVSDDTLTPLTSRALHFNAAFRPEADRAAAVSDGRFAWSNKWPTSEVNATAGLLVREAEDGRWVTGVAWEDFLAVQGHNPWNCLHTCVRIGALKPGESRTIRGRLYLFAGTKEDCFERFKKDFPVR